MRRLCHSALFAAATTALAAAGLLMSLAPSADSSAPVGFTVDTTIDSVDISPGDSECASTDGQCSLRAAVMETNALPGANEITLPEGKYRLTIQGPEPAQAEDESANGDLDITGDLTISGAGAWMTVIEQTHWARVIQTTGNTTVRIEGLTVRGGDSIGVPDGPPAGGGGIRNEGALTLDGVTVTDNVANRAAYGGGIDSWAPLTVLNSTIYDNYAVFKGGGIAAGTVTVVNSTISGNESDFSTGGGIWASSATLENVTVTGNDGGNLEIGLGTLTLANTIIANPVGSGANCDLSGPAVSQGHNIDSDGTCGLSGPGDLSGVDPQLLPLAANGGQTLTHALAPSSSAIDAGDNAQCPETDQRGASRPVGAVCDIGAFEYGGAVETPGPTATPRPPSRIDVNCDNRIASDDAQIVLRHVAQLPVTFPPGCKPFEAPAVQGPGSATSPTPPTGPPILPHGKGDADCNGSITAIDALAILRYVAGIPMLLQPGCPPLE